MSKPLPKLRISISKPVAAHWSMALVTVGPCEETTCIISGFSVTQGATVRIIRRTARPHRSRSVLSCGKIQAR